MANKLKVKSKRLRRIDELLAKEIGVWECAILLQLDYLLGLKNSGVDWNGHHWVYKTYEVWTKEDFPFLSSETVRRAIKSLESQDLVVSKKRRYDKLYRIDYEALAEVEEKIKTRQKDQPHPQNDKSDPQNDESAGTYIDNSVDNDREKASDSKESKVQKDKFGYFSEIEHPQSGQNEKSEKNLTQFSPTFPRGWYSELIDYAMKTLGDKYEFDGYDENFDEAVKGATAQTVKKLFLKGYTPETLKQEIDKAKEEDRFFDFKHLQERRQ